MNYHKLGEELQQQQKWDEAVTAYRQSIESNPNFSWSYHKLGQVLAELQQWEEAVTAYQKAIETNPNFSWSYYKLGEALAVLQRWEEAVIACEKAVEINPGFPGCYRKLADVLSRLSRWEKAIDAYQNAINLNPNSYGMYKNLWYALTKLKKWDEAVYSYRRGIEINPNAYWFYYQLGYALKQQGLIDEAIAYYQKALELKPDLPWFHIHLGDAMLEKRNSQEAIALYIKAIELQPDFYLPYNKLKAIHSFRLLKLTENQLDDLVACYRKAIENKPELAEPYLNLANILSDRNQIEEARICYQKSLSKKTGLYYPEAMDKSTEVAEMRGPDFLIIGTTKGGTTSLYNYICLHPSVLPAIEKEVHFFDTHFDKGINWYLAHFPAIPTDKNFITGEASPNYMYFPEAAERLFNYFPKTKLIAILRNPINRTISHYYMAKRQGQEAKNLEEVIAKNRGLIERIEKNPRVNQKLLPKTVDYLRYSLYIYFLKAWMKIFPREQFLILKSEDMYEYPAATMKQVFEFLELPDYQISEYRQYFAASYPAIDENMRQTLSELFRPHNWRLEKYLGRKFNW